MNRVVFSSASDHWATPKDVYGALDDEFRFTFDPCPLMAEESGLLKKWGGRVFCNPPYSAIDEFLKKGLWHLSQRDCELLVYLIPSRTDTRWFHEYCIKASEIRFLKGRLKFGDAKNSAPFPSMLVIFKEWAIPLTQMEAA
jgi:phage N-6-adenine-methyltransferase